MVLRAGKGVWRLRVGFRSFAKGNSRGKGVEVGRSRSCKGTVGTFLVEDACCTAEGKL